MWLVEAEQGDWRLFLGVYRQHMSMRLGALDNARRASNVAARTAVAPIDGTHADSAHPRLSPGESGPWPSRPLGARLQWARWVRRTRRCLFVFQRRPANSALRPQAIGLAAVWPAHSAT